MNSGKVRLNSGILERRHSNWDQALHHFRRAREIDDTYCEPDYWIGASLLQQGKHVQLGLMVGSVGTAVLLVLYHATTAKPHVLGPKWHVCNSSWASWWVLVGTAVLWVLYHATTAKPMLEAMP